MKYFNLIVLLLSAATILNVISSCNTSEAKGCCEGGRCTGSAYCTACSNCSRCAHCGAGGSCGVCASPSRSGKSEVVIEQPKNKTIATSKENVTSNDHETTKQLYKVTASLNLRDAPRMDANIIAVLPAGTRISVTDLVNKEWAKVETIQKGATEAQEKATGYVSRKFILKVRTE